MENKQIVTHTRLTTLARCAREHYYRYECGLVQDREPDYFRVGRAFHVGMDALARDRTLVETCAIIDELYRSKPEWLDGLTWSVERETVIRLIYGWDWYWQCEKLAVVKSEDVFSLAIVNPETEAPTPLFQRSGKRDQIVRLPDGRTALREFKTTSSDISADSDYWHMLRIDPQISGYFDSGIELDCIIYDVTRKPAIRPKLIAENDENGCKIVLDADGNRVFKKDGAPRESGDAAKGLVVQQRIETPTEFGERLTADIGERPEFYFARKEIPRTEADVNAYRQDLWQQQQMLRWRQKKMLWPRSPGQNTCSFCAYKRICFNNEYPITDVPDGYRRLTNIHPELEIDNVP